MKFFRLTFSIVTTLYFTALLTLSAAYNGGHQPQVPQLQGTLIYANEMPQHTVIVAPQQAGTNAFPYPQSPIVLQQPTTIMVMSPYQQPGQPPLIYSPQPSYQVIQQIAPQPFATAPAPISLTQNTGSSIREVTLEDGSRGFLVVPQGQPRPLQPAFYSRPIPQNPYPVLGQASRQPFPHQTMQPLRSHLEETTAVEGSIPSPSQTIIETSTTVSTALPITTPPHVPHNVSSLETIPCPTPTTPSSVAAQISPSVSRKSPTPPASHSHSAEIFQTTTISFGDFKEEELKNNSENSLDEAQKNLKIILANAHLDIPQGSILPPAPTVSVTPLTLVTDTNESTNLENQQKKEPVHKEPQLLLASEANNSPDQPMEQTTSHHKIATNTPSSLKKDVSKKQKNSHNNPHAASSAVSVQTQQPAPIQKQVNQEKTKEPITQKEPATEKNTSEKEKQNKQKQKQKTQNNTAQQRNTASSAANISKPSIVFQNSSSTNLQTKMSPSTSSNTVTATPEKPSQTDKLNILEEEEKRLQKVREKEDQEALKKAQEKLIALQEKNKLAQQKPQKEKETFQKEKKKKKKSKNKCQQRDKDCNNSTKEEEEAFKKAQEALKKERETARNHIVDIDGLCQLYEIASFSEAKKACSQREEFIKNSSSDNFRLGTAAKQRGDSSPSRKERKCWHEQALTHLQKISPQNPEYCAALEVCGLLEHANENHQKAFLYFTKSNTLESKLKIVDLLFEKKAIAEGVPQRCGQKLCPDMHAYNLLLGWEQNATSPEEHLRLQVARAELMLVRSNCIKNASPTSNEETVETSAIELMTKIAQEDPHNHRVFTDLGDHYFGKSQFEKSFDAFNTAIERAKCAKSEDPIREKSEDPIIEALRHSITAFDLYEKASQQFCRYMQQLEALLQEDTITESGKKNIAKFLLEVIFPQIDTRIKNFQLSKSHSSRSLENIRLLGAALYKKDLSKLNDNHVTETQSSVVQKTLKSLDRWIKNSEGLVIEAESTTDGSQHIVIAHPKSNTEEGIQNAFFEGIKALVEKTEALNTSNPSAHNEDPQCNQQANALAEILTNQQTPDALKKESANNFFKSWNRKQKLALSFTTLTNVLLQKKASLCTLLNAFELYETYTAAQSPVASQASLSYNVAAKIISRIEEELSIIEQTYVEQDNAPFPHDKLNTLEQFAKHIQQNLLTAYPALQCILATTQCSACFLRASSTEGAEKQLALKGYIEAIRFFLTVYTPSDRGVHLNSLMPLILFIQRCTFFTEENPSFSDELENLQDTLLEKILSGFENTVVNSLYKIKTTMGLHFYLFPIAMERNNRKAWEKLHNNLAEYLNQEYQKNYSNLFESIIAFALHSKIRKLDTQDQELKAARAQTLELLQNFITQQRGMLQSTLPLCQCKEDGLKNTFSPCFLGASMTALSDIAEATTTIVNSMLTNDMDQFEQDFYNTLLEMLLKPTVSKEYGMHIPFEIILRNLNDTLNSTHSPMINSFSINALCNFLKIAAHHICQEQCVIFKNDPMNHELLQQRLEAIVEKIYNLLEKAECLFDSRIDLLKSFNDSLATILFIEYSNGTPLSIQTRWNETKTIIAEVMQKINLLHTKLVEQYVKNH